MALDLRQDAVEPHPAAARRLSASEMSSVFRNSRSALNFLQRRFVVHAIDQRHARLLAGFGGGDIGEDHEFLDQPVRVEPLRHDHAIDGAVGFQQDLALGKVEIERIALVARACSTAIGGIERFQDLIEQRSGGFVGAAVDRGLRLRVIQLAPPSGSARDESVCERLRPSAPITMRTASAGAVLARTSEHRSLEMRSGSIGTTRSGK